MPSSRSCVTTRRSTSAWTRTARTRPITTATEMLKKLFALAAALTAAAAFSSETVMRVPVADAHGHRDMIDVTVHLPGGPGPFPIVVLSHGSPRSVAARRAEGRQRLAVQSQPFLVMGFAVLVPTRRGYGESGGEWAETYGSCRN